MPCPYKVNESNRSARQRSPEDSDRFAAELQLQQRVRQAELALAKEGEESQQSESLSFPHATSERWEMSI